MNQPLPQAIPTHQGSCLCGRVQYRIAGTLGSGIHCHCRQCQKHHGAAFGTYLNVKLSQLDVVAGVESISRYPSSAGVARSFCQHCGSSLFWHSDTAFSEYVSVTLATLDSPFTGMVTRECWTQSRVGWLETTGCAIGPAGTGPDGASRLEQL